MQYQEPTLTALESAVRFVQAGSKQGTACQDAGRQMTSSQGAYELDE